ncbi:MAG: hypothetical protein NC293_13940 [Roseburia sp.]|nr:hypothetical protein [Roseburia sp.]
MKAMKEKEKKRGEKRMKIKKAKSLSLEKFSELDDIYGGFDGEKTKNHQIREEGESFMDFMKKGSKKIKNDPVIKKILE